MNRRREKPGAIGAAALAALLALGAGGVATADDDVAAGVKFASRLVEAVTAADLVFRGTVQSVGDPPAVRSGRIRAVQTVTYRVERVLLGDAAVGTSIQVAHVVVSGSANAEPGENRLSTRRFRPGNVLLVVARTRDGGYTDIDESYGTLEDSPEALRLLERLVTAFHLRAEQ